MNTHKGSAPIPPDALLRLALFDPKFSDECGHEATDYIVLQALAPQGQLVVTPRDIRVTIKKLFLLDYEETEIEAAARRLAAKELLKFDKPHIADPAVIQLTPGTDDKLSRDLLKVTEDESSVLSSWKEELRAKYNDYPSITENLNLIEHALKAFMAQMLLRHGIQCVELLYPEEAKTRRWLTSVEGDILATLPKYEEFLDAVVRLEIPAFLRSADAKRRAYVGGLANSSFFWHLLQVDEKCSRLLRAVTHGIRLYIDVNVLYCLAGLDGPHLLASSHAMLSISKKLGCSLIVTSRSLDEFQSSLKAKARELEGRGQIPRELAKVAIGSLEEDDFISVYWRELAEKGVSIQDFAMERSHASRFLSSLAIEISDEHRQDIETSQELREQEDILRSFCRDDISEQVVEHDAFHRILVLRARGTPRYHASDAGAWFLTNDSKLPAYDRRAREQEGRINMLPFCVTSNEWVQINRPLLTRTDGSDEYERSFHLLVTQPFVRSLTATFSLSKAYSEVLTRAARYKSMTPQLALSLITDKQFVVTVGMEVDPLRAEERIENKLAELVTKLQDENAQLSSDVASMRGELSSLNSKVDEISQKSKNDIERQQVRARDLEGKLITETSELSEARRRIETSQIKLRKLKSALRWMGCVVLWAVLLDIATRMRWGGLHGLSKLAAVSALVVGCFGALAIPLGMKRTWSVLGGIAALASILGLAWILLNP